MIKNKITSKRKGFTLMELSIVILVIAILIGAGMYGFNVFQDQAKRTTCASELQTLAGACSNFAAHNNTQAPAKLQALLGTTNGGPYISVSGNWTAQGINDPWGVEYTYTPGTGGHGKIESTEKVKYPELTIEF